jgi:serine/threonine protein kinase
LGAEKAMVKAASTASASSLLALVEKSGLLADRLAEVQALAGSSDDARSFARQLVTKSLVTKWQAGQLLNGFYQFNLGKYRLLDQIGVGRIGREFLAEHVQLGKRVAIKLVSRNLTTDSERLKQFLAESRRAVSLDHPHLVHSMDVDQEGQRYYVVTEFVDGEDLQKRIARTGPCSPAEALSFIRQAAEGLQHAAVSGVLHGDLKPSNLLIDKQGSLKVADLGFARLVDAVPKVQPPQDSQEQNLQDGIEYYAPEALNAAEADMDCRADMYSLGQTLYFLLKGMSPPVAAESVEERKTCLGKLQLNPGIVSFFARLTAPQAKDRPANWKEVIEQLRALNAKSTTDSTTANGSSVSPTKRKPLVAQAITLVDSEPPATVEVQQVAKAAAVEQQPTIATEDKSQDGSAKQPEVPAEPAAKKPTKPTRGKKIDPKLVIGIAIGGGALLLLVSVGVLWMLLGGGPQKVAELPKDKHAAKAEGEKSKAKPIVEPEEETNPEKNPEPALTPAEPATKPGEGEPKPPIANVVSPQPVPEPKPEPKPEPEPKSEPKPEPTPTATPTPTPTPEPPKSEPTPAQPAVKPFEKFPPTLTLPDVNKPGELFTVGELALPADKGLRIQMHGGEGATRNKSVFVLQNANAETDDRNWEVVLQKVIVAKLHREPDKLTFEWMPEAATQQGAAHLCNCLLQLNALTDEYFLPLRTPVEYDPETIDLEKGSKWNATIDNLPSSTVVELVGLDPKSFPNPDFKSETKGKGSKIEGPVVWYGDGLDARNLGLLIDKKETGKRVDVNIVPVFRAETMAAQKLNKRLLPELLQGLEQQLGILTAKGKAIDTTDKLDAATKAGAKQANDLDMQRVREQHDRISKALELHKQAHNAAVVHIRVSYETGAGKVVLAQTKGAPPPEPLGRKPAENPEEKK